MPLRKEAQNVLRALEQKDVNYLYGRTAHLEKDRLGITKEKLARLVDWWHECVGPFELSGDPNIVANPDEILMEYEVEVRRENGHRSVLVLFLYQTRDGNQLFLTRSLVQHGLFAKYGGEFPKLSPYNQSRQAIISGMPRERRTLESMGLLGLVDARPNGPILDWDDLIEFAKMSFDDKAARGGDS
ncbi:MAG: hypothetical protein ACK4XJ_06855 [Fimbriimonadaceae bacterium]